MSIEEILSSIMKESPLIMKLINLYIWIESTNLKILISRGVS